MSRAGSCESRFTENAWTAVSCLVLQHSQRTGLSRFQSSRPCSCGAPTEHENGSSQLSPFGKGGAAPLRQGVTTWTHPGAARPLSLRATPPREGCSWERCRGEEDV